MSDTSGLSNGLGSGDDDLEVSNGALGADADLDANADESPLTDAGLGEADSDDNLVDEDDLFGDGADDDNSLVDPGTTATGGGTDS